MKAKVTHLVEKSEHVDAIHKTDLQIYSLQTDLENNLNRLEKMLKEEEDLTKLKEIELEVAKEDARREIQEKKAAMAK